MGIKLVKIFVSSPCDVEEERNVLDEVIDRINRTDGEKMGIRLEVVKWESNVVPQIGPPPQHVVDDQTPEYGIYLGIIAKRFGTPTDGFGSGTEAEFRDALERFYNVGKPWILFYFKEGKVELPNSDEIKQYGLVHAFKEELQKKGLVGSYKDVRGTKDGFFEQVEQHLRIIIQNHARPCSVNLADDLKADVTGGGGTVQSKVQGVIVLDTRRPILDLIGPAYVLDSNFFFLDWNPIFDKLIAKDIRLARGDHAVDFVKKLKNCNEVIEHSKGVFGPGKDPLVDTELLQYKSPKYGLIEFRKIAAQIADQKGKPLAWSVSLNILSSENDDKLWEDIEKELNEVVNWSRYSRSYDKLLLPFDDYNDLLELVVSKVGDAQRCVDLGSGTGNGTIKLLESNPKREVWSVESNENMLRYMEEKVNEIKKKGVDFSDRFIPVKDDILTLGALRDQTDYFDAAILVNVLYSVDEPAECLRQAYKILKPGGILSLSTAHSDTDVEKLFNKMQSVLRSKESFDTLQDNFEAARQVHIKMENLINRDSKEDIDRYIEEAGFEIKEKHENEYVDAVVVIKAIKKNTK